MKYLKTLTLAAATAALGATAHAQSADAIIDKLVEKGILTTKEAQDLRDEADKNFTTALATKTDMADWVTSLKFHGDIRGRYEMFSGDNPLFTDRQRLRYRMRFGAVATLLDNFEAGLRLSSSESASGGANNEGDPISGNTTFQNNGSKKLLFIDQAYGKWSPLNGPNFLASFTIGKMENPFVFSDMVFDADYTPEGLAAQLGYIINDNQTLRLNAGYFVLDELSASSHDSAMLGAQLRWDANWTPKLSTSLGAAYLDISSAAYLTNSAVPNINRGNTRAADGRLAYGYRPFVLDAAATYKLDSFPMYKGAFPIKVMADYMVNDGAPGKGNDVNGRPADNYAYTVGVQLGKSGKKGTWDLGYSYKWLGANAWYEELVDSDFGGFYALGGVTGSPFNSGSGVGYGSGTNVKGHIVRFQYSPSDSFTFTVKWLLTELISPYGPGSSEMSRLQIDGTWKF